MLQKRNVKSVLICLIIIASHFGEQANGSQGQHQGRIRFQQSQQAQPQIKQLEDKKLTQEREQKAKEMLKYMNSEADACQDFYTFACGNWLQEQVIQAANEGELISAQSKMESLVNKQLQSVLNEPISSYDSMASKVAKNFYESCLRVPAFSPAQRQFMQSFVVQHGGLPDLKGSKWQPNYNWVNVIAELRRTYGMDILIGLRIDRSNPNHKVIYVQEPETTMLPVELCSSLATRQINENDQVFEQIQLKIKQDLKNWLEMSDTNAERVAGAIVRFEFDLCKYMRLDQTATTPLDNPEEQMAVPAQRRGYSARMVENKMHGVRQNMANSLKSLKTLTDTYEINFKDFVDLSLDTSTVAQVQFRNEEYFQQLHIIARKGLQASFANYIMYRALSELNFPPNEHKSQRRFYCVQQIMRYMPQALSKIYSEKFYDPETKEEMGSTLSLIKTAFEKQLQNDNEWMSENTKRAIRQKLHHISFVYPTYPTNGDNIKGVQLHADYDYWQKLETLMMYSANQTIQQVRLINDHMNYVEASTVGILHKPGDNKLFVGLGLLQKPFYSRFYNNALKFSSLGVAIAREIVKMFDYQGLQSLNSMNTFPWDHATMESFPVISECFRSQISNYFHNNPNVYRNATKLREFMVETSAVSIAFNAYLKWLEDGGRHISELQMETLPDMNFTNTQLFFINFAQTHCAARHKVELLPDFLPMYRHTMEQHDINGPLSNNAEFGRDFGCEIGSAMNLDDKCVLY